MGFLSTWILRTLYWPSNFSANLSRSDNHCKNKLFALLGWEVISGLFWSCVSIFVKMIFSSSRVCFSHSSWEEIVNFMIFWAMDICFPLLHYIRCHRSHLWPLQTYQKLEYFQNDRLTDMLFLYKEFFFPCKMSSASWLSSSLNALVLIGEIHLMVARAS